MNSAEFQALTSPQDVDVRGFSYALEPIRQQQEWRLDKTMALLAQARQALEGTQARMAEVLEIHDQHAKAMGRALSQHLDPVSHRSALGYLARLRVEWKALDMQRDTQLEAQERLRQECMDQQMRLDGLTRHKGDALTEYAHEARQRSLGEQDRDWLARRPKRAASPEGTPW